ncbi:MAG: exonuclease domain-containing protein [Ruminococcaceae bacterium]|nr:exonuclease domain-containing protein [Oscillospiraceae bacterium]
MDIIILDLEWDSAYSVKSQRFVNQIIQIGAVKLDENCNIIDTFSVTVKSRLSKKLTKRFVELTGITNDMMRAGIPLAQAVEQYNAWAGKNTLTMTWSTSDLYTIIENCKFLLPSSIRFRIEKYADLQSYIQNEMRESGFEFQSQISLANAAVMLNISSDGLELHQAKDDCLLSVALLKRFFNRSKMERYIKDASNPEFFRRLTFKSYTLSNIKDDNIKPENLIFKCDKCGNISKCVTGWKYRNGWFSANFRCAQCKRMYIGRVSFKKTYDDLIVKKRIIDIKAVESKDEKPVQSLSEKV